MPAETLAPEVDDEYLDLDQGARLIGVARGSLARLDYRQRWSIPTLRAGRLVRFSKRQLIAWLEARQQH